MEDFLPKGPGGQDKTDQSAFDLEPKIVSSDFGVEDNNEDNTQGITELDAPAACSTNLENKEKQQRSDVADGGKGVNKIDLSAVVHAKNNGFSDSLNTFKAKKKIKMRLAAALALAIFVSVAFFAMRHLGYELAFSKITEPASSSICGGQAEVHLAQDACDCKTTEVASPEPASTPATSKRSTSSTSSNRNSVSTTAPAASDTAAPVATTPVVTDVEQEIPIPPPAPPAE